MKTIKIIDLLNKIANGEEVPLKIKYDTCIWVLRKQFNDYWNDEQYLFISGFDMFENAMCFLNDEVEIIEEEIEKLNYKVEQLDKPSHNESLLMNMIRENKETINKLIDELKTEK